MEEMFAMTWERTAEATSPASPERVWAVLTDGLRWSAWNPGVEWMTVEGPLAPGSVMTMKPRGAPQTALRIEAVVPDRLLALVVTFGPLATMRLRWELTPADGRSRIGQAVAISGPLAGMLLRKAALRIAGGMQANLERLAERARSPVA
ncbi:MAG: hypothetical protein NVS3B7_01920 [Candidatus Elarobacter sp.]